MTQSKGSRLSWLRATLTGVGVVALSAGALALPTGLQQPEAEYLDIESLHLSTGPRTIVCPGSPTLTAAASGSDVTYDLELDSGTETMAGSTTVVGVGAEDVHALSGLISHPLTSVSKVFSTTAQTSPRVVQYTPQGEQHPSLGGVTIGAETSGDLRGLVAGACAPAASSTWLVGGDTSIGSSTQLVLTNPGETATRVSVQAWTGIGPVSSEIVTLVDAGSSSLVLTETLQRTDRIAFHVSAQGGGVGAYLVTTSLDGIVPGGVSYVTASAAPGLETFVGPLQLPQAGTEGWVSELRLVNPGSEPADVSVSLLGPEGEVELAGAQEITVDAGMVSAIPLSAEQLGDYTVRVRADAPLAAGVSTQVRGEHDPDVAGSPEDLSWMASTHPTPEAVLLQGPSAIYAVTNPSDSEIAIEVEQIDPQGDLLEAQWYAIEANQTIILEAPKDTAGVRVRGAMVLASTQYSQNSGGLLLGHVPAIQLGGGSQEVAVVANN